MKIKLLFLFTLFLFLLTNAQSKNETIALNWIKDNSANLKIQPNHKFQMLFSRKSLSGETLRYYQFVNDVEVYDSSIVIHISNNGVVTHHSSTYDKNVDNINTQPNISKNVAFKNVIKTLDIKGEVTYKKSKLYVYNKLKDTKLVYRFVTRSDKLIGVWETFVDAHTGTVIGKKNIAVYHKKETKKKNNGSLKSAASIVNGTAMVFDTDPLSITQNSYGGSYVDNNDATNTALNNARTSVTLQQIQLRNGIYTLKGPYVEIAELEAPSTGLFQQNTPNFNFTRDQQGFEATNCYYHLDTSLRYINLTLGITLVSLYNGGVLRYDPHALNGADQSYYANGTLNFGEGGVDDAEDADVILHELGHGLHDWLTNNNPSQVNGLSEGCGDYWANSYKRSLGLWADNNPARNYIFGWDGHNPFWAGRTTTYNEIYPEGLVNQIHTDGQIWASVLMEIWEVIGREKTDKAFLEGLGMTNSNTNQQNAAIAVRQAAIDMNYTCDEINVFTTKFKERGYILPIFLCNAIDNENNIDTIFIFPNPSTTTIDLKNIKKDYEIEICNFIGQIIITKTVTTSEKTIDISKLSSGIYILRFKNNLRSIKFIKS